MNNIKVWGKTFKVITFTSPAMTNEWLTDHKNYGVILCEAYNGIEFIHCAKLSDKGE